jgi:hypothetical protein
MFGVSLAAEFTLSSSEYVSAVDIVLGGPGVGQPGTSTCDFALQSSLAGPVTPSPAQS